MAQARSQTLSIAREFTATGFLWRLMFAMILVLATYNPTGFSYFHWLREASGASGLGPEHFVVGVLLTIGWAILLVATQRSLGTVGLVLAGALLGGLVWWFTDLGVFAVGTVDALAWVSLTCLGLLLAVGLSWSHIWRRITGQLEVDDNN